MKKVEPGSFLRPRGSSSTNLTKKHFARVLNKDVFQNFRNISAQLLPLLKLQLKIKKIYPKHTRWIGS